jgi:hypothetical protein
VPWHVCVRASCCAWACRNEAGQWARAASPGTAKQAGPPGGGPLPPPPTPAPPQPMVSVVDVDLSGHQAVKPVVAGQA